MKAHIGLMEDVLDMTSRDHKIQRILSCIILIDNGHTIHAKVCEAEPSTEEGSQTLIANSPLALLARYTTAVRVSPRHALYAKDWEKLKPLPPTSRFKTVPGRSTDVSENCEMDRRTLLSAREP
jgi:hypothetical protein